MAARTRRTELDKEWRARIQVSMLFECLQKHAAGKLKMSATQIRAAEILLRKVVPDLSSTTVSGDPDNPLAFVDAADAIGALLQRPALRDDGEADSGTHSDTVQ